MVEVLYVLISGNKGQRYLHGVFTGKEISKYRRAQPGLTCYIVPINKYVEKGMWL